MTFTPRLAIALLFVLVLLNSLAIIALVIRIDDMKDQNQKRAEALCVVLDREGFDSLGPEDRKLCPPH